MKKKSVFKIQWLILLRFKLRSKYNNFKLVINNNNISMMWVYLASIFYFLTIWNLLEHLWMIASRIIIVSGDSEMNPGLRSSSFNQCLSIYQWKWNSIHVSALCTQKFHLYQYTLLSRNFIFASLKLMTIWKHIDMILLLKITHLTVNKGEPALLIRTCYHLKLLM